jgi:hypothetical protein
MPGILTPELALRHLLQLSTDVRAASALSDDGRVLAGKPALAAHARELLSVLNAVVGDGGGELLAPLERAGRRQGSALVAKAAGGPALVVAVGPHALLPLLRHDLATLLEEITGAPARGPDVSAAPARATSQAPAEAPAAPSETPARVAIWNASRRVQTPGASDSAVRTAIFAGLGLLDMGKP